MPPTLITEGRRRRTYRVGYLTGLRQFERRLPTSVALLDELRLASFSLQRHDSQFGSTDRRVRTEAMVAIGTYSDSET